MTSANVTEYTIRDLSGKEVGSHYQSHLCKTHWGDLLKFQPLTNFTIQPWGYDEEEEYWEGDEVNLNDFVEKLKKNRATFNTMSDILNKAK
jgi:hypothetical protein